MKPRPFVLLFLLPAVASLAAGCRTHDPLQLRHMKIETIHSDHAPKAIGPYSQAIAVGDLVFCSGQIALDPQTGQMVGEDAASQAKLVLKNLGAVLDAAGSGFDRVLKTTIFLADMADYAAVNEVYAEYFVTHKPARAAVAVKTLPKNALVEIECIATRKD